VKEFADRCVDKFLRQIRYSEIDKKGTATIELGAFASPTAG